jgi:hypothetical protein
LLTASTGDGGNGSGSEDGAGSVTASPSRGGPQDIIAQAPPRLRGEPDTVPDTRPQLPLRSSIQRWQVGASAACA